jgi:hypothetical protein
VTVSLKSNFFSNARGITFADGGGVTWSFNYATNQLTATAAGGTGVGTVTSVGLVDGSSTSIYTLTGSPVTASGNLTFTFKTQSANTVLAGPVSGVAAQPTFRALVAADIPQLAYSSLSGTPSIPSGANPTGAVGLSAVNGSAATFLRSDSAPALSQAITPTWTGVHTFGPSAGVPVTLTPPAATTALKINSGSGYAIQIAGPSATQLSVFDISQSGQTAWLCYQPASNNQLRFNGGGTDILLLTTTGCEFSGALGVNGNSPPAQSTGWGTSTGGSVQNNFSGSAATLATLGAAVAQLITVLKAVGILGT